MNIFISKNEDLYQPLTYKNDNSRNFKYNSTILEKIIYKSRLNIFSLNENLTEAAIRLFKTLLKLRDKNRLIIFATHNREFAEMSDCKIEMIDGNITSINGQL